jgi:hypothetical protein
LAAFASILVVITYIIKETKRRDSTKDHLISTNDPCVLNKWEYILVMNI